MTEGRPWFAKQAQQESGEARLYAPAAARNRDAIAAILADELPRAGRVLEIASGSGEHVVHFARLFPALDWQPSDPDPVARASIIAWTQECALSNIAPPVALDAAVASWPVEHVEAVLCINMVHISPWESTLGLFAGAARLLPQGGPLILYGPFLWDGMETAPSNLAFDTQLRARDARYGLRSVEQLDEVAAQQGLWRTALHQMPANNLMLIYRAGKAG